jgi:hypothetical protein
MDTREGDIDMEITEEELEAIKERSYNLGAINASLDNIGIHLQRINYSLDEAFKKFDEFKKRAEEADGMEGIDP